MDTEYLDKTDKIAEKLNELLADETRSKEFKRAARDAAARAKTRAYSEYIDRCKVSKHSLTVIDRAEKEALRAEKSARRERLNDAKKKLARMEREAVAGIICNPVDVVRADSLRQIIKDNT